VPKTSSIRLAVSKKNLRLVTDGRTDGRTHDDSMYGASMASRSKNAVEIIQKRFEWLKLWGNNETFKTFRHLSV